MVYTTCDLNLLTLFIVHIPLSRRNCFVIDQIDRYTYTNNDKNTIRWHFLEQYQLLTAKVNFKNSKKYSSESEWEREKTIENFATGSRDCINGFNAKIKTCFRCCHRFYALFHHAHIFTFRIIYDNSATVKTFIVYPFYLECYWRKCIQSYIHTFIKIDCLVNKWCRCRFFFYIRNVLWTRISNKLRTNYTICKWQ